MQIETLAREFSYNGAKLADPAPTFTLQQVRDFYSQTYPELTNGVSGDGSSPFIR